MKAVSLAMLFSASMTAIMPSSSIGQPQFFKTEGVAAIAAGSINPPDPVKSCNQAKQHAKDKAASAGYKGHVEWEKLSLDSDCSFHTEGKPGVSYFFIFTASGKVYK